MVHEFEEGPPDLNAGDAPVRTASANSSLSPIARSSSITSCSERSRLRLAQCAPRGSTVLTVSPFILRRILTSLWSLPPISRLCAPTLASGAGTSCAS